MVEVGIRGDGWDDIAVIIGCPATDSRWVDDEGGGAHENAGDTSKGLRRP